MHREVEALADLLREAVELLERHRIDHWASWLRADERRIRNLDFYGVQHLLSAFGGMGSLNDVALANSDPDVPGSLKPSSEDPRFQALLTEIHRLASKLAREEGRER